MAIRKAETFDLVHPDWLPESFWTFRSARYDLDEANEAKMVSSVVVGEISRREMKRWMADGGDPAELVAQHITSKDGIPQKYAILKNMSQARPGLNHAWYGPEFEVPDGFIYPGEETVDPFSGKLPPCNERYIALHDTDMLDEVLRILRQVWAGRSPEEAVSFLEADRRVGEPVQHGEGEGGGGVPDGDAGLQASETLGSNGEPEGEPEPELVAGHVAY